MEIKFDDYDVDYEDSDDVRNKVFDRVMQYFKEHECFDGESIMQMDDPIIDAPNVMCDLVDIIGFKTRWHDED